jgi:hypothetical protein
VYIAQVQLDDILKSIAVPPKSKINNTEFQGQVRRSVNWHTAPNHTWTMSDNDIRVSINHYSDRFIPTSISPLSDLLGYVAARGLLVIAGAFSSWWRLLGYNQVPRLAPGELIGGIGEGIAGYWLDIERNWNYIIRPVGVTTDGIVVNNSGGWGPIEVKTSIRNTQAVKDLAISASRELLRLYTHHDLAGHGAGGTTLEFALSIGVRLSNPIEVYCIEYRV